MYMIKISDFTVDEIIIRNFFFLLTICTVCGKSLRDSFRFTEVELEKTKHVENNYCRFPWLDLLIPDVVSF